MIDVSEADRIISASLPKYPARAVPIQDGFGAILREPILTDRDQPPFDRVTMDGIAIRHAAWERGAREFTVAGVQRAGDRQSALADAAGCIEVMTGAVMPSGADCVVRVEDLEVRNGRVFVKEGIELKPGSFVHPAASDCRKDAVLLEPGCRLTPPRIAIVASSGASTVAVAQTPRVAVISTGDELVEAGAPVEPHQVRLSNVYGIDAGLRQRGFRDVTRCHLPDDITLIRDGIGKQLVDNDVLILTGGVSMGKFDYVPQVLRELGVEQLFHKVAQRPGKPMWYGTSNDGKPVFGLPGNPVSALVCFCRFVLRHLDYAMGLSEPNPACAVLTDPISFKPDLTYFLPVALQSGEDGRLEAKPCPTNTSGDFGTLGSTDGIIELARNTAQFDAGHVAPVYRWDLS